jgi:ABC-type multidrug transport system permease subunit
MRIFDVLRSKSSAAFFLAFPVALVLAVGFVFSAGHPFERRRVVLVESDSSPALAALADELTRYDAITIDHAATEAEALGRLRSRMATGVMTSSPTPTLVVGPRDELFARGAASVLEAPLAIEILEVPSYGYVHYLFPGMLTFSILLTGLFGMGWAMARFRQSFFLKKLATTPLPKSVFIAAQIAARALLALVQTAVLVAVAALFFSLPITLAGAAWTAGITTLGLIAFMGAGFALACVVKTEELMGDVIGAITFPLVFLSELFFPADGLPAPLPSIAEALPSTHMVRALRSVLVYDADDLQTLLPSLAVLVGWIVVTYAISFAFFRWHR